MLGVWCQAVATIQQYPTEVTFCIISNRPQHLRHAIRGWAGLVPESVCGTDKPLENPVLLTWVHREHMTNASLNRGVPSSLFAT
jgi:hypothetical protein